MKTALWWIRRDLRLADNQALAAAMTQAEAVLPVFVLDPKLLNSPYNAEKRLAFLFDGLRALDADLRQVGNSLIVRSGEPGQVLSALVNEVQAGAIFAEEDYSPYARWRDRQVASRLPLFLSPGLTMRHPADVLKANGTPYTVFTPYSKAWLARPWQGKLLKAPPVILGVPDVAGEEIPAIPISIKLLFSAGETEARRRLEVFSSEAISSYQNDRNRMDLAGTSGLSPYLRFGMLSARQAVGAAWGAIARLGDAGARRGAETWLNELIWREFYISILYHYPQVRSTAFRPNMRDIRWNNDPADYEAWTAGLTGYPIVDAAMRQLTTTGWMHNRARMITASFLTKNLLVDWRWGEKFFMQHLIDGDPAANNGGWQWTAGTGTDAAPYFRVFNPLLQGQKFDPHGAFIRSFVPELALLPDEYIHTPWLMPASQQESIGCKIGVDYPNPIVDLAWSRQRALDAYQQHPG